MKKIETQKFSGADKIREAILEKVSGKIDQIADSLLDMACCKGLWASRSIPVEEKMKNTREGLRLINDFLGGKKVGPKAARDDGDGSSDDKATLIENVLGEFTEIVKGHEKAETVANEGESKG